jgi:hypothetical protein
MFHDRDQGAIIRRRLRSEGQRAQSCSAAICIAVFLSARDRVRFFATITGKGYRPSRIKPGSGAGPLPSAPAQSLLLRSAAVAHLVWQSFFRNLAQPFLSRRPPTLDKLHFILSYLIFLDAVRTSVLLAQWRRPLLPPSLAMAWIAQRALPRYGLSSTRWARADRDRA